MAAPVTMSGRKEDHKGDGWYQHPDKLGLVRVVPHTVACFKEHHGGYTAMCNVEEKFLGVVDTSLVQIGGTSEGDALIALRGCVFGRVK